MPLQINMETGRIDLNKISAQLGTFSLQTHFVGINVSFYLIVSGFHCQRRSSFGKVE